MRATLVYLLVAASIIGIKCWDLSAAGWAPASQPWFEDLFGNRPYRPGTLKNIGEQTGGSPGSTAVTGFLNYAKPWLHCKMPPLRFNRSRESSLLVVDMITTSYDLDILEIRLVEHSPYVDYFIIVESTVTQRGAPKPMFFKTFRRRFQSILQRIVYVEHTGKPFATDPQRETVRPQDWRNENEPRQYGFNITQQYRGEKPLVVISGDADELWSAGALMQLRKSPPSVGAAVCPARVYMYANGISREPKLVRQPLQGQFAVAWRAPAARLPFHRCTTHLNPHADAFGYHLGGFLSPVAWIAKELSLAESWGVARRYGDPKLRVTNPYLIYNNALAKGAAPCCPVKENLQQLRLPNTPIPTAILHYPQRYPYLTGSNISCPVYSRQDLDVWKVFNRSLNRCNTPQTLFGQC